MIVEEVLINLLNEEEEKKSPDTNLSLVGNK
jgi:hypothetical protein